MKRLPLLVCIHFFLIVPASGQEAGVHFKSSDTALENAFTWAKAMALHYKARPGDDPVGPWYESALPPRYAFCMRDVSHQCIGAEILGMHPENKNMFTKFTSNISASKDWCSYWEIDKFDRPSPYDYRSDREFWYNLNANFDLLDACWRTYLWTGDIMYLKDPAFLNFYARSSGEYICKWTLQPDSLLIRGAYPNAPVPFNIKEPFDRCRGLPSYSEGVHNLKMGVDLVAALYRGLTSYAAILKANGDLKASGYYRQKAKAYQKRIDTDWWDERASLYHTHYTNEKQFGKAEGETFLLWFDALKDSTRKRSTIEHQLSMNLNVENLSYLPLQYYRNGYWDKAYALILRLANPSTQRREYPEVSYGLIEGVVQGLMGVDANSLTHTVSTIYRSDDTVRSQLMNLPILNTTLTLTHFSPTRSAIINTGKHPLKWKARFSGDYEKIFVNKDGSRKLKKERDEQGQVISYLEVDVAPGEEISVRVLKEYRIAVTEFGAMPDSRNDATAAIRKALTACRGKKNAVLVFPKGRYDLFADSATQKEYFISNTSSESECPSKVKRIGLLLEEMKNLRIEGEGSLLMFHGKMITFALDHCNNIRLHNLEMDFERPTMSEFTVTKSTSAVLEVIVHPDSWYRLDSGRLTWYGEGWRGQRNHCIRIDTVTHAMYYANKEYGKLMESEITELAPFRLRFRGSFDTARYMPGNVFTVRDPVRDEVGAFIVSSKNIGLKNIRMRYMHGLGIVSQYSENISMDSVTVEPRRGSGRRIASFADGMHFSGCKGRITIEHCRFNGLHDDAVNIHGTHLKIVKRLSDHQLILCFMHPQTYGFMAFFQMDSVAFIHPSTLGIFANGQIKSVKRLSDREILVTLQGPIPDVVKAGDVIENTTWTPEVIIRHCLFTGTNTRGLLVTTRRKVVIEDNEFVRLGMQAILIADDALNWYESGAVRDVLIRHNVFRECGHNLLPENNTIAIAPENHELTSSPVHRNIRIEDNRFYCYRPPVLIARSVERLSFTGNTIIYTHFLSGDYPISFHLIACTHVAIRNNRNGE